MNILTAMHHPKLFAPYFRGDSWVAWESYLGALFGLAGEMTDEQAAIYRECTGRETLPDKQFRESFLVCGRRAGKSRILSLAAIYLACFRDWREYLAPGEKAMVLIVAADRRQAKVIRNYISGMLQNVPALKNEVLNETNEEIELSRGVTIQIGTRSFRAIRGYTILAALLDEVAFWRDENSANPDAEVLAALRPAMATIPGSVLLAASSPYARRGILYDAWRRWHGKDDAPVLVWHAPTLRMNPLVPAHVIAEAYERDGAAASAEYGAEWRTDVESYIAQEVIDAAVCPGRYELPRISGLHYRSFVDPSGGSSDAMTLAIAHEEGERAVLDAVREVRPPFSPEATVTDFVTVLRSYGVSSVTGDRYAGEWAREPFRKLGVEYLLADRAKSDLYRDLLPMLNSGKVELLDLPRLSMQLVGLERRTARGGRDSIDHAPGGHDDLANAVAGALLLASKPGGYDETMNWVGDFGGISSIMFSD